jgi:Abortive infection alpha/Protein of unknown function (DUF2806)
MTNMTDEENAALVVKEGMKQLFAPYNDLINKLLGPAVTEIGLSLGDSRKVWRFKRRIRFVQEVKRMIDQSGKDIKPLATRLFFPVFEAASIEDDDEMQTRWAALLANEATNVGSVHPSFVEILKQLAPDDARMLDRIVDWCEFRDTRTIQWWQFNPRNEGQQKEYESLDNLVRLGLVVSAYVVETQKLKSDNQLSEFAVRFVAACRAPKPSESSASPDA